MILFIDMMITAGTWLMLVGGVAMAVAGFLVFMTGVTKIAALVALSWRRWQPSLGVIRLCKIYSKGKLRINCDSEQYTDHEIKRGKSTEMKGQKSW